MAEFKFFPENIKKAVLDHIPEDENVEMCFVAGSRFSLDKEYVIITPKRVIVVDERPLGSLGRSYVNIRGDLAIKDITSIRVRRTLMDRLFGLSSMQLELKDYRYIISNSSSGDIDRAVSLIHKLMRELRGHNLRIH